MESPVRICIGAAFVALLLLLSSSPVSGNDLLENSSLTLKENRTSRHSKTNSTIWTGRSKPRKTDSALNELNPKESVSEEHTEKNAKYKHRGRVRFGAQSQSTTSSPRRRVTTSTTTKKPKASIIIVTPEPEKKNISQIMDSMRVYKKTKMPSIVAQSTSPTPVASKEDYSTENDDSDEYNKGYEYFYSTSINDGDTFTPTFESDSLDSVKAGSEGSKVSKKITSSSYDKYSSFVPGEISYRPSDDDDEPFKSILFQRYHTDLTTPKNDFFDKKFKEISSSIIKNIDQYRSKASTPNKTNIHKALSKNIDLSKANKNQPSNKSTVIFKNTKEVHLVDNEDAESNNQELSDVQGTSIYYETSVLSTETYAINQSDDDCDNDTAQYDSNSSTTEDESLPAVTTLPSVLSVTNPSSKNEEEIESKNLANPVLSTKEPFTNFKSLPYSGRVRTYKRLNSTGTKFPGKLVLNDQVSSNQFYRPVTRKFYLTTPKIKPTWMAPRRNVYTRTTLPTTIYSEHFNIKDSTTPRIKVPNRIFNHLSTVSSDIDPVLHSDVGAAKKVVHSQSISDNSIPNLWKRGSTKFKASTTSSTEIDGMSDLEIPPTLAWTLAGLRSLPGTTSSMVNSSTHKNDDYNELQDVGEVADKKETTTSIYLNTPVPTSSIPIYITLKTVNDIDQNKLPSRPATTTSSEQDNIVTTETKSERLPAESNISVQNSDQDMTNEPERASITEDYSISLKVDPSPWLQSSLSDLQNKTLNVTNNGNNNNDLSPPSATKPSGFESITKLPSSITTPQGDDIFPLTPEMDPYLESNTAIPTTTDYEVTTIRFTYIPTITEEPAEAHTESISTAPSRVVTEEVTTILDDTPVTTYRPSYMTSPLNEEDITTDTPKLSSMNLEEIATTVTELPQVTTKINKVDTIPIKIATTSEPTTSEFFESTTIIEEATTKHTIEMETPKPEQTTILPKTSPTTVASNVYKESVSSESSGSNEVITQEVKTFSPFTTNKISTKPHEITTSQTLELETHVDTEEVKETTTAQSKLPEMVTKIKVQMTESTTGFVPTKSVSELEDLTTYNDEITTEASSRVITEESVSGAAIAIAVSTIGVIALILLIGLLLIVRRRGRRGVYAQRCTPVSLDAYSLDSVSVGRRKGNHRLRSSKRSYGNPAFDDEVTSHPMQYAALANFAMDNELMSNEFVEIPTVTVRPDQVPPGCEDKNRYSNVLPLPETRVPLQRIGDDPTTEYINANYVTGPGNIKNYYILCQTPLPNTVVDTWRMIWEQNSRLIVMLTEYMENGVEKSYEYLPPSEISDNRRIFGDFQVILKKREQRDKYAISTVQLFNLKTRTWREITHLWYFWPAKGVPDDYDSVIDFLSEMRGYMKLAQTGKEYDEEGVEVIYGEQSRSSFHNLAKLRADDGTNGNGVHVYSPARAEEQMRRNNTNNGTLARMKVASDVEGVRPCVVMCASGAGRSAALVTVDAGARTLAAAGAADVPRVVRDLRAARPHALANRHHYIFVYKVLSEYGNKLMGGGVDTT